MRQKNLLQHPCNQKRGLKHYTGKRPVRNAKRRVIWISDQDLNSKDIEPSELGKIEKLPIVVMGTLQECQKEEKKETPNRMDALNM